MTPGLNKALSNLRAYYNWKGDDDYARIKLRDVAAEKSYQKAETVEDARAIISLYNMNVWDGTVFVTNEAPVEVRKMLEKKSIHVKVPEVVEQDEEGAQVVAEEEESNAAERMKQERKKGGKRKKKVQTAEKRKQKRMKGKALLALRAYWEADDDHNREKLRDVAAGKSHHKAETVEDARAIISLHEKTPWNGTVVVSNDAPVEVRKMLQKKAIHVTVQKVEEEQAEAGAEMATAKVLAEGEENNAA